MNIKKEDLKELYPLTRMQEGMLFHALREPASLAYTEQVVWHVSAGDAEVLDVARYQAAWDAVHARYEALRSVFTHEKTRRALQLVLKTRACDFACLELGDTAPATRAAELAQLRRAERERGFDLGAGPLLRVRVVELGQNSYEICVTWHHILLDGWSTHMMFQDLEACYTALGTGSAPVLAPLAPYAPYIEWLERQDQAASLAWWAGQLEGYAGNAEIARSTPAAAPAPARTMHAGFHLDDAQQQALVAMARAHEATPNNLLQAVWGIVLGRYTDSRDVVFGTVVSGRSPEVAGIERVSGLLINTIPVRVRYDSAETFESLLARVQRQAIEAQPHHSCRLAEIQNASEQRADLIRHLLVYENYPLVPHDGSAGGPALRIVETCEPTSYELLVVADAAPNLRVDIHFNAAVYDPALASQLAGHLQTLLLAAISAPHLPIVALDMLAPQERASLQGARNVNQRAYPRARGIADEFGAIAGQHGARTALIHGATRVSYAALERRANQLAHHLIACGVQPGQRVLVLFERSVTLIESILAILKVGAVYVPGDPEAPAQRLQFVLADAGIETLILPASATLRLPGVRSIHPDALESLIGALPDTPPPAPPVEGDTEACLLYTSGSSGAPKGVRVTQRGLMRLARNNGFADIGPDDCLGHLSHVAFDATSFEIWGALLNGAALAIVDRETALNPAALARQIRADSMTILFMTTALFNQSAREAPQAFATLATLLVGGEQLDGQWIARVLERGAPQRFYNAYGPTETTTFATTYLIQSAKKGGIVPIGLPIGNTSTYVVDRDLLLQPAGAPGELLIGGDGVATGYLNRAELTAERFIADPFRAGATVYRTGDIVRRRLDGEIEFIGRRDSQVKLRGFRIELGEIEVALRAFAGVDQALLVLHSDEGSDKLVAYLGMAAGAGGGVDLALRQFLRQRLPDYMIPSSFVLLERLPMTANGKIDRAALPKPTRAGTGFGKRYSAPEGELETQLAQIWASVLGVEQIGRDDSFFELGGHSLSAASVISHIRAALQAELDMAFFFQCPNLTALALEVERLNRDAPVRSGGIARARRVAHPAPEDTSGAGV